MQIFIIFGFLIFSSHSWSLSISEDLLEFAEGSEFKTNIYDIEALNLKNVMLPEESRPWSGSFWPDRAGSIAVRYTNSDVNEGLRIFMGPDLSKNSFNANVKRLQKRLKDMEEKELGKLSPAEKYDLLVGDENFTFSKKLWDKVDGNKNHWGGVTFWTGICHGWAPASIHLPRPKRMIRLPIMNGTRMLPIYPDDIKALGSYLWANKANHSPQMFSGNRCNQKRVEINKSTGEVIPLKNYARTTNECSDVDPLVMHLITVNRIGLMKRSFVVEVDFNAPVNNHPLAGYEMKFFNVNNQKFGTLKEAILSIPMIKNDILKDVRHNNATQVVGVQLKMILTHWRNPERRDSGSATDDKFLEKTIFYQLDLDPTGEPLKGHWRIGIKGGTIGVPNFPDFIWNDYEGFRPREYFTKVSEGLDLDLTRGLDSNWLIAARKNSLNTIKLSNASRITHRLAKKKSLQSEMSYIMRRENISREDAANQLADALSEEIGRAHV